MRGQIVVVAGLALALGGCSWVGGIFGGDDDVARPPAPVERGPNPSGAQTVEPGDYTPRQDRRTPIRCARVNILGEANKITVFAPGGGRDLTDVEYTAEFREIESDCDLDKSDRIVEASTEFQVVATRGPAARNRQIELPIFVALARADGVIDKRQYPLKVIFPAGEDRIAVFDAIEGTRIYLEQGETGSEYEILVGFQLTRNQLEYNRRQSGR